MSKRTKKKLPTPSRKAGRPRTRVLCLMCGERPARVMTGKHRDGSVYVNAQGVELFCSQRCATNYALLFNDVTAGTNHWCPSRDQWINSSSLDCTRCSGEEDVSGKEPKS